MATIELINKVFHPAIEIRNPEYFVGRKDEIKDAVRALSEEGSFITLWGNRGAGKSSLLRQIQLVASGDGKLVEMLGIER